MPSVQRCAASCCSVWPTCAINSPPFLAHLCVGRRPSTTLTSRVVHGERSCVAGRDPPWWRGCGRVATRPSTPRQTGRQGCGHNLTFLATDKWWRFFFFFFLFCVQQRVAAQPGRERKAPTLEGTVSLVLSCPRGGGQAPCRSQADHR